MADRHAAREPQEPESRVPNPDTLTWGSEIMAKARATVERARRRQVNGFDRYG